MLPFMQSINSGLAFILILSLLIFQHPWKLSDNNTEVLTQILILEVVLIIDRICLLRYVTLLFLIASCRQLLQCAETCETGHIFEYKAITGWLMHTIDI